MCVGLAVRGVVLEGLVVGNVVRLERIAGDVDGTGGAVRCFAQPGRS